MRIFSDRDESAKSEIWALLALRHARGIGARRAKRLWENYGSGLAAVEACLTKPATWVERSRIPLATARSFASEQWRERAKREWAALQNGVCFLCIGDAAYPELLRELPDAPLLLYYRGDSALLRGPGLGIVGARDCTQEGIAVSAFFARELSRAGVSVISGLARGIDRAAHLAGLEGPGRSIGVLGAGVDIPYPACNADLHALMAEKGLLLSEFAPGTPPESKNFPIRNRLISGLSRGVLVVEAAGRSGSLITARLALEQNRELFAVPGHTMAAVSGGCRELIRRGAKAVFNADDILEDLAPLLTKDARAALDKRLAETHVKNKNQARKRREEPLAELQGEALSVLPPGQLPWKAPDRAKTGPRKKTGTRTPARPETDVPARPVPTLPPELSLPVPARKCNEEEQLVLDALAAGPLHIDEIARKTAMDVAKLSGLLTLMEIRGLLHRAPGMIYTLSDLAG